MATLANLIVNISANMTKFNQALGGIQGAVTKTGSQMASAGRSMTAGFTLPLVGAAAAALKLGTDMNASMANVATLIPGSTARVEELKTTVQEMAIATGKATGDLAGGLYQVISAFGDSAETATILKINAEAAAAGLATTTDAINLTSAVTKGYGDTSAAAVQQVSDLAFQAVKLGQTTFPELAASIGLVTPLAVELGVAQEELFGVMGTATGVTGAASQVSTQLRGVLQSLMAPTETMSALYEGLGFASGKAMLEQLGLQGTINALVKAAEDTNTPLQKYIGSIEGQTLALALAGPQADVFSEKLVAMTEAAGATAEAFREQTQGINKTGFELAQAQQKAAVMAQQLGDALAPALSKALDAATPLIAAVQRAVEWFTSLDASTQQNIITFAAVVAALGPVLVVLGTVIGAVGNLIGVIKALGVALSFLTANQIGAIIMAIAALVTGIVLLIKHWDEVKGVALRVWATISDWIGEKVQAITGWFSGLITSAKSWGTNMMQSFLDGITGMFSRIRDSVTGFVSGIVSSVKEALGFRDQAAAAAQSARAATSSFSGADMTDFGFIPPGMARGGSVLRPGLALVGERGPEILNLPRGAQVAPLSRGGGIGGGGGMTVNISVPINAPVYGMLDFEARVKETIRDAIQGGAFRGVISTP